MPKEKVPRVRFDRPFHDLQCSTKVHRELRCTETRDNPDILIPRVFLKGIQQLSRLKQTIPDLGVLNNPAPLGNYLGDLTKSQGN